MGIWAVPVFPATVYPGTAALVPVPAFTTCSSMVVSSESTEGEKTSWVAEGAVWVQRARGADGGLHELRRHEDAAVGHRVVGVEDLQCAHGVHLADGQRHVVGRLPLGGGGQQPRRLAGEVQPGRLPEPERLDLVQQALLADALGDLRGADVGGLRQDLRRGERFGRVRLGVVEGRAVEV